MGEPRELNESAFSVASFTILRGCKMASFHGISARDLQAQFQFLKSSQAMAGGGRRMKKTRQTTDIK